MAIKTIKVKNFKSFEEVEVHLGKFNVLIAAERNPSFQYFAGRCGLMDSWRG